MLPVLYGGWVSPSAFPSHTEESQLLYKLSIFRTLALRVQMQGCHTARQLHRGFHTHRVWPYILSSPCLPSFFQARCSSSAWEVEPLPRANHYVPPYAWRDRCQVRPEHCEVNSEIDPNNGSLVQLQAGQGRNIGALWLFSRGLPSGETLTGRCPQSPCVGSSTLPKGSQETCLHVYLSAHIRKQFNHFKLSFG